MATRTPAAGHAFSFLEAAALPEALAERAGALGQPGIALLDADGVYGAPRLYRACTRLGLSALVGAEVTLADGSRLPLLVEDVQREDAFRSRQSIQAQHVRTQQHRFVALWIALFDTECALLG